MAQQCIEPGGGRLPVEGAPSLWRWRLRGGAPPVEATATVGEAARAMAMRTAGALFGTDRLDACLHGPEVDADGRHLHAFWLPEDRNADGRIDHLTVFAPGGLSLRSRRILSACERLFVQGVGATALAPVQADGPADPPARLLLSATPYVGPAFARKAPHRPIRPRWSARRQLIADLNRWRGPRDAPLPAFAVIEVDPPSPAGCDGFRLGARHAPREELFARGWFGLVFARPVAGPLALGLGAHFGLGRFTAPLGAGASLPSATPPF